MLRNLTFLHASNLSLWRSGFGSFECNSLPEDKSVTIRIRFLWYVIEAEYDSGKFQDCGETELYLSLKKKDGLLTRNV